MADSATPNQGFCGFSEKDWEDMKKDHEKFMVEEKKKAEKADENRKHIMPNDDGVVSVCAIHGRYFHDYDFRKEKVMNREIKCPICGKGEVWGEFKLDIPDRSHEWEY